MQQLLLEEIDCSRRALGRVLDTLGLGRQETPHQVVFEEPGLKLRAYGESAGGGPPVLLIPAPIKGAYLWDLAPDISVVQRCLRRGLQVYLVQWEAPRQGAHEPGLADYADRLLLDCVDAIEAETGESQLFLLGHSLGGTLATIFACLHPDRVRGLVLLGAPLHFALSIGALGPVVAMAPPVRAMTAMLGDVPGSFLDAVSTLASPWTFQYSRWLDWLASLRDSWAWRNHLRVERWMLDELPMPRRLFEETVELLYREDRLTRGSLLLRGRRVSPKLLESPILAVVDPLCSVAPPQSVMAFLKALKNRDTRLTFYEGDTGVALQHVGMLVGRRAHDRLWPEILDWMQSRSEPVPIESVGEIPA